MIKNLKFRKFYAKINLRKYTEKIKQEIEQDYLEYKKNAHNLYKIEEAKSERNYNLIDVSDNYEIYLSNKIINRARKYSIPLPSPRPIPEIEKNISEYWTFSDFYNDYYLNDVGRYELVKKIREEKKLEREKISFYSSILLGILGLLVGVLSQL